MPLWFPILLLAAGAFWLLRELKARAAAVGFENVDFTRAAMASGGEGGGPLAPPWLDPRWELQVREELARAGAVHPLDREALGRAVDRLSELSFVRQVLAPRVLWPSGVEFDLEFRRPVACVRAGERFYGVDAEGVVLGGAWSAPPWIDSGYLPLLVDHANGAPFSPGDRVLGEAHLLDALDVAVTFWLDLEPSQRGAAGRIAIDGRRSTSHGPADAGVLLLFEGQRAVLFGRPPGRIAGSKDPGPGELDSAAKWRHVAMALERASPNGAGGPGSDWRHLDVRFDAAAIDLGPHPLAALPIAGGAMALRAGAGANSRDGVPIPAAGSAPGPRDGAPAVRSGSGVR